MRRFLHVLVAPLLLTIGGEASVQQAVAAVTHQYIADLASGARQQGSVLASGIEWNCRAARCTTSGTWDRPTITACRALAQLVGPVNSYGRKGLALTPDELRECNAGSTSTAAQVMATTDRRNRAITPDDFIRRAGPLPSPPQRVPASPRSAPTGPGGIPIKLPPPVADVFVDAGTLRYAGASAVTVDAGTMRYDGNSAVTVDAGTLRYSPGTP